ncbi:mitochondrial mRNA pseudouridine synthase RPUSD3 isoform X2 [Mauremys reevesii]|uniref:mitochondrial mRNA pseudouridine synthase RPUSD3 isoform X2 n=1 Tax=Mauremys reevesii TaxID=260615 RepID=UPI00193FAF0D|nr:mitochondrial mRNA pseudouridine synthase RPUSD3 isoform X2 [Mauremys reevesii]
MAAPRLLLRAGGRPRAWYQQPLRPGGPGRGSILGPARPWSRQEALGLLEAAVVYRAGPLVAVSKPPGLAVTGSPGQLSLVSLLPDLSQRLSLPPELHVVKTAGNLCLGTESDAPLQRRFWPCASLRLPWHHAAAPCILHAAPESRAPPCHLPVVPVAAPSRREVERKEVKQTLTRYKVLGVAPGCGLVQLQPMTAFPGQLLVHLTLLLCPALGDHVYSARVGTVLGEPFLLPVGSALPRTQVLGEQLLRRLRLTQQLLHRLPLHLHLHQLLLPTAILTAPPPPFFLQTLRLLGLPGGQSAP